MKMLTKSLLYMILSSASAVTTTTALGQPTARLALSTAVASAGSSVVAKVQYRALGSEVSALQFDLEYDPSVLTVIPTIGNAAEAADKTLAFAVLSPGHLRAIVFGLNQTVIGDGDIVGLNIQVIAGARVGPQSLAFSTVVFASPEGDEVPATFHSGIVVVTGPQ
jgi:hypothetical protein